ncbi:MAG: alpha/beta hydrolase [Chloroflexi bacterium]|nr:alpha/beta hydrolase [Chloroflexota bacterium]MCI0579493.1 alpha/beta hydrolase [Chloroflexota bacterium]MCI0650196.1 alpha/beta hydrolase [Chloroflexota bacterium]MCI0729493.1 alpha/beta hydrolase [Chloroflexota bacterium]
MSSIVTEQGILHYESIGRGQPIILLHGWINSWDVWRESMIALASERKYRVYALDFWGFGDSAKGTGDAASAFQISSYVEMVRQFMDTLGILHAPVAGHSMGGTVALQLALNHPERIKKVAVVGSPIIGSSLNPFLKLAGYGWIAELVWRYPFIRSTIMRILLAGDSKKVRQMIFRDVQRTSIESFFRSIGDLRDTDLRGELGKLTIQTLGIYGTRDNIVSPTNAELLISKTKCAEITMMEHSRHFPMTDEPERFVSTLTRFMSNHEGDSLRLADAN